jgi:hypothetical protein
MSDSNVANTAPAPADKAVWWRSDWFFTTCVVVVTLGLAYGLSVWEVVSRAKNAFQKGEQYYRWMEHQDEKKSYLSGELSAKRITQEDFDRLLEDSDLKNAYMWYETAVDLFQPPRSQWVVLSETRLKELKPKREEWLKSLGIDPVDDSAHPDTSWHW